MRKEGFLKYIAYLQIIGIVLVVLGHSFHEYPDGDEGRTMLLYRMLHSFRMPVFMFVSGFLMIYTTFDRDTRPSWKTFALGKVKRLMVPFVVLTLVTFVPRSMLSMYADDQIDLTVGALARSLLYRDSLVIPYFWFLHSSLTLLLGLYFLLVAAKRLKVPDVAVYVSLVVVFVALNVIPFGNLPFFSLGHTFRFGLYFVMGASYCRFRDSLDRYVPWTSLLFLFGASVLWAVLFFMCEGTDFMPLCSIVGIGMCVSLSKIMVDRGISLLDHLVGANYIIFLLSWYFNVFTQQILHKFVDFPWYVHTVMSLICGIYVPWLFYRYMCSHPDNIVTKASKVLLGQSFKARSQRGGGKSGKRSD